MPTVNLTIRDLTRIKKGLVREIVAAEKRGVKLAAIEGSEWIKEAVFEGQKYVGHTLIRT